MERREGRSTSSSPTPAAGHRRRFPAVPPIDRSEPSSWSRSLLQPPHRVVSIAAPPEVPIHRSFLAMKPSPLAPLPSSTPAISGDETAFDGFARKSYTFPLLVASAEEPPFAADTDGKLACAASILRLPPLLLLLLLPFLHRANDRLEAFWIFE